MMRRSPLNRMQATCTFVVCGSNNSRRRSPHSCWNVTKHGEIRKRIGRICGGLCCCRATRHRVGKGLFTESADRVPWAFGVAQL